MTQTILERKLKQQLENLNDLIDRKIVRGLPYTREAKEHKNVLLRLSNLRKAKYNWVVRSLYDFKVI